MADAPKTNGSVHGISLLVGQLQGAVEALTREVKSLGSGFSSQLEHVNVNIKQRDAQADQQRESLREEIQGVKAEVGVLTFTVAGVQQDVAEMKNDTEVAANKLAELDRERPIIVATIGEVTALKAFKKLIEDQRNVDKGWWAVMDKIGKGGWAIISALGAAGLTLLIQRYTTG